MMATEEIPATAANKDVPIEERVYEAEGRPPTFFTITLEKVRAGATGLPVGTTYTYTYKSLDHKDAIRRASLAMARDLPGEERLDWRMV